VKRDENGDSSRKAGLLQTLRFIANYYNCKEILLDFFVETRAAPVQCQFMAKAKLFPLHHDLSGTGGCFITSAVLFFAPKHSSRAYEC